ncbi:uncharacterized protein LOC112541870 [Python bivittatus]|uniref:Uncharacterized protein LOC112541870 n=1 Tax=Python bivittatus TaxID=176946 RepID=A0A9F5J3M0_PYTBI|nr:uncharacterized protein LOC112541870 [Python bivittatus]
MTTPPGAPHEKFDAPENAEAIWGSRPSLSPPMCPQAKGERACLEKGLGMVKERIIQHLLPVDGDGLEVMQMDSLERTQGTTETKRLNGGGASKVGFGEKDPSAPPARAFSGGRSVPLVEAPKASSQKNQPEGNSREKKPLKRQPGRDSRAFPAQRQASAFPSPSVNLPPGKAAPAEDLSEPTDSNSQWSEISQFYGGSSSFGHLSLTLVEQSLREEELRARHQSALLRLREKALQEKAQAELAWLEHGERCPNGLQGTGGPSSTAKKQLSILTKLKQEQAEIKHLQNIGRAAHQERKLLLQQQKDLLEVQKTTTQLWLQLAGKLPHQVAGNPNPQGAAMLEKGKVETSFEPGPLIATHPGGFEGRSRHAVDKKHRAEPKETLPRENQVAEGFSEWKPGMGDPPKVLDLYDSSGERSQNPALSDGRTAGRLASQEEKEHNNGTGLTKNSQEDHPGYPLDKSPEGLASTGSSSKLHGFSPYPETSPSGLEFYKANAILVNLSGSSLSPSDLEEDDLQDTDVSLPEEFVFQEQLPDNFNDSMHHGTPVMPRIVINRANTLSSTEKKPHVQISGGDLGSEDLCILYSQEKVWEDAPETEQLVESGSIILLNSGRLQRSCSPLTKKDHIHTPTFRSSATSLNISDGFPGAENDGGNKMTSQNPVDPGVFSSTNVPLQSPEDQGAQDPVPFFNGAEEDGEDGNTSHFGSKNATVTLAPDVSLTISTPQDSEVLTHGQKHSFCLTFPDSSDHLLVSDGKTGYANCSADECLSNRPNEITLRLNKTSLGSMDTAKENQNSSSTENQNTNKAGIVTVGLSSSQRGLLKNEGDAMHLSNTFLPELEDDILSPVDEVLTYGSSDLPSSTEKDASSWSTDLPAPPENLTGKDDETNSSLLGFPSPPDPLVSSEAEELSPPCNLIAEGLVSSPHA